jgi:hypothetical protein
MRQQLLVSAALAVGLTTTALAADVETLEPARPDEQRIARQCLEDLQAFDQQLLEAEFGVLPPGGYGLGGPTGFTASPRRHASRSRRCAAPLRCWRIKGTKWPASKC